MEWRLLEAFSRCIHPSLRALIRTAISEQPWAFLICLFEWLSPSLWSSCFLWRKPMWKPCMCVNTHPYYVSKWLSAKKKSKKLQSFPSYFSCLSSWAILEQNMYILRIIIIKKNISKPSGFNWNKKLLYNHDNNSKEFVLSLLLMTY